MDRLSLLDPMYKMTSKLDSLVCVEGMYIIHVIDTLYIDTISKK